MQNEGYDKAHVLIPNKPVCSCGKWQDLRFPCKHACVFARKYMNAANHHFFHAYTAGVHRGSCLTRLFERNINLVVRETVDFDGVTKPPEVAKKVGRPKVNRFRRRIQAGPESGYKCGICGETGHNRATCGRTTSMTNSNIE